MLEVYFKFLRQQASFDVGINTGISSLHVVRNVCRLCCITFVRNEPCVSKKYRETRPITLIIICSALRRKSVIRTMFYLPVHISNFVHVRRNLADPRGRAA